MKRPVVKAAWLLLGLGMVAAAFQPSAAVASDAAESVRDLIGEARFAEAEALALEHLEAVASSEGSSSLAYARAQDLLVEALLGGGKAIEDQTEALAFDALEVKERLLPAGDGELSVSLTNLGSLYLLRGDPGTSRTYLERALTVAEAAYGPRDPSLILTLRNLGSALKALGELEAAEVAFGREAELIEEHRRPEHLDFAANAYNTAWLLVDLGDFAEAERLFDRARRIVEQAHGPESPRMVWVLLGLGTVRDFQGDFARAVATHERALEIATEALGLEHPMVSSCETNLGAALTRLGDFERAQEALRRALTLTERSYGPEHENTGRTLKSLAEVSYKLGNLSAAEAYLSRAIEIFEQAGADYLRLDADVVAARNSAERGDYDAAIANLRSVVEAGVEVIPKHPDLVIWEVALGDALLDAGRNREAATTYLAATRRAEDLGGVEYRGYLDGFSQLATALARSGDPEAALAVAAEAEALSIRRTRLLTAALPERQALRVVEERPSNIGLLLTLAASQPDQRTTREAWVAVIRARGAILDELAFRHQLASAGHVDLEVTQEYATASRRMANLLVHGLSGGDSLRFNQLVDSARRRRENAEKRLAVASLEYRRLEEEREIGLVQVVNALPAKSALVAFVVYQHDRAAVATPKEREAGRSLPVESQYGAFVSAGPGEPPRFVPLGPAGEIDAAVAAWRGAILEGLQDFDRSAETAYRQSARQMKERIWDPIVAFVGEAERVFIVPDAQLHRVNFGALPVAESEYLVDRFQFHYLSSERDLVPQPSDVAGTGLLALGGADYEEKSLFAALNETGNQVASLQSPAMVGTHEISGIPRGLDSCPAFSEMHFSPLPGATSEAIAIASRWNEVAGERSGRALVLSGGEADEARFKTAAPGHKVLHVATHGFFLEGQCPTVAMGQRGIGGLVRTEDRKAKPVPVAKKQSPLQLSGLVLAGANHRASAMPDEEDGILTAEEIATLDLSSVEWAVLSGCDTGLGEIRAGEGVFGLRRAFRAAGAQTLIMSLWPVRDKPTAEWMEALYDARLEHGADTVSAMSAASRSVLQRRREEKVTTHPAFWAGFVASGEWR